MTNLVATAVGMTSSLGLDSAESCAGARAGIVRLTEIDTFNYALEGDIGREGPDGVPQLSGHRVPVVGQGAIGLAKLLALSRPAMGELLGGTRLPAASWTRCGLLVNISDAYFQTFHGPVPDGDEAGDPPDYAVRWAADTESLAWRLCSAHSLPINPADQRVHRGGHTGVAELLLAAARMINAGQIDRCIVGSVESCIEPYAIQSYASAGVLKCAANPAGFIPGEAAAFILVERASQRGAVPGAFSVTAIGSALDKAYTDDSGPPHGVGVADSIERALSGAEGDQPLGLIVTDLNGCEFRAADWGNALVHLRSSYRQSSVRTWLPALSFGETGAASGGVALCMAFRAIQRRYVPTGTILITLSGEQGARAAIRIDPFMAT
jgi:hypothetical protein